MTGKLTGNVVGGDAVKGSASNNTLLLHGANITGHVTGGRGVTTNNNVIDLKNTTVGGTLTGGTNGSGNTVNVRFGVSKIGDFQGIQNLHFYLENGASNTSPALLEVQAANKDIRGLKVGVGVSGFAPSLQVNDVISLMKVGNTLTMNEPTENHVEAMQALNSKRETQTSSSPWSRKRRSTTRRNPSWKRETAGQASSTKAPIS